MILLLYGPDTYRSRQKLNEIIEHYKSAHKSWLNLKHYDAEKDGFEEFFDELKQAPMFKEKKLIVLKNVFSNNDFKEKLLKYSKNLTNIDGVVLFFEESKVLEKDRLLKFLKENGRLQKFEFLRGVFLRKWVKSEFEKYGAKPGFLAIETLISFVGSDSWQLSNEIRKIASYCKNKNIEAKDITILVRPKIEINVFGTIEAIAGKNKKKAILLLRKHLQKGDSPLYLLSMIRYQFRNLLLVKSRGAAKFKLHPYVIRKSTEEAKRFSFEELKKIYQKIFETDLNIKTGRMEPEMALELLITEI